MPSAAGAALYDALACVLGYLNLRLRETASLCLGGCDASEQAHNPNRRQAT